MNWGSSAKAGSNVRDALSIALSMGCSVHPVDRTGELRVSHPLMDRSIRIQHPTRRKDSPRALTTWMRRMEHVVRSHHTN